MALMIVSTNVCTMPSKASASPPRNVLKPSQADCQAASARDQSPVKMAMMDSTRPRTTPTTVSITPRTASINPPKMVAAFLMTAANVSPSALTTVTATIVTSPAKAATTGAMDLTSSMNLGLSVSNVWRSVPMASTMRSIMGPNTPPRYVPNVVSAAPTVLMTGSKRAKMPCTLFTNSPNLVSCVKLPVSMNVRFCQICAAVCRICSPHRSALVCT